ncbi:CbtB domain-containing protein [Roseivivax sediminis]|uniref:Cobalt transporter subunit CbtB n=1 Tax=Roseivivax sediminis TaxID=936889 RepID=A0A1I1U194_9RHOB|nr:CbtB domain-containing protein [Roseivivax sediminis]SFD64484.1 cobalt transporter subunit CbtB [Roseivivax sediminis]
MNATSTLASGSRTGLLGAGIFAALIGVGIVTLTGHVQASALHDAAHDVRHATGFPCH